jgi:hypothetical protein
MRSFILTPVLSLACCLTFLAGPSLTAGDDDVLSELKAAKERAARQSYKLRYKFQPGDQLRYNVVHLTTSDTRMGKTDSKVQTRSISTKLWRVEDVDPDGLVTFVHLVEDVDMWSQLNDSQAVRYKSSDDAKPPVGYESVANSIGVPLARITIDRYGKVVKRQDRKGYSAIRGEQIVDRLPPRTVQVGDSWFCPHEIILRDRNMRFHRIDTRKFYRLDKVSAGVATIHVETQVLTPINSPALKGQLVKWLTSGTIKFDIDAGRVLSLELGLDEKVIGFSGADSMMEYMARRTEKLLSAEKLSTARRKQGEAR